MSIWAKRRQISHSSLAVTLMESAAAGLAEALDRVAFQDARCPLIANVSAQPVRRADEIRAALRAQLLGAVRWEESMRALVAAGAQGFVEIGTGRVLRGLLRNVAPEAARFNVEDAASLAATLVALGAQPGFAGRAAGRAS